MQISLADERGQVIKNVKINSYGASLFLYLVILFPILPNLVQHKEMEK